MDDTRVLPMTHQGSRAAEDRADGAAQRYDSIAPLEATTELEGWERQPDTARDDLPGAIPLSEPSEDTLASLATSTKVQEQLRAIQEAAAAEAPRRKSMPRPRTPPEEKQQEAIDADAALNSYLESFAQTKQPAQQTKKGNAKGFFKWPPQVPRPAPSRGVQGWPACPHAQPGCPTPGAPSAAARQLHLLTYLLTYLLSPQVPPLPADSSESESSRPSSASTFSTLSGSRPSSSRAGSRPGSSSNKSKGENTLTHKATSLVRSSPRELAPPTAFRYGMCFLARRWISCGWRVARERNMRLRIEEDFGPCCLSLRSSSNMDPLHVERRLTWPLFQCGFDRSRALLGSMF